MFWGWTQRKAALDCGGGPQGLWVSCSGGVLGGRGCCDGGGGQRGVGLQLGWRGASWALGWMRQEEAIIIDEKHSSAPASFGSWMT